MPVLNEMSKDKPSLPFPGVGFSRKGFYQWKPATVEPATVALKNGTLGFPIAFSTFISFFSVALVFDTKGNKSPEN